MTPNAPSPASRTKAKPEPPRPSKLPRMGWLEMVVVAQTMLPALMFIPQLLRIRTATRIASFALPLMAFALYTVSGRKVAGGRTYPPSLLLLACLLWYVLSLGHPQVNTLTSAMASIGIATGVFCPAFWAPAAITDTRQVRRLLILLLLCNGASALVGVGQVYYPEKFRPPKIALFEHSPEMESSFTLTRADGKEFLRPPGLTDTAGGAALGGMAACSIGLAVALTPCSILLRATSVGLAMVGLMVLFYCQVRSAVITLTLSLIFWMVILGLRGEIKKLSSLLVLCGFVILIGISIVLRDGGEAIFKRFGDLFEDSATTVYYNNRGAFIEYAFNEILPAYPLGAGPGRIGMASFFFGNPVGPPDRRPLYAETQIKTWIIEGGIPLLVMYSIALIAAFISAVRTALFCPDPEVAYWAGAVVVFAMSIATMLMAGVPFMAPIGVQFWAMFGALYGAQELSRVEASKARIRAALETRLA